MFDSTVVYFVPLKVSLMTRNLRFFVTFTLLSFGLIQAAVAVGLGNMRVQSSLGAQLKGEIDITQVGFEEEASLTARIPNADIYRQAGLEFNPAISQLRVAVNKDGKPVIMLSSTEPITEPILELLVEINWATGRLVRQYTVMLDPADMRPAPSAAPLAIQPPSQPPLQVAVQAPPAVNQATVNQQASNQQSSNQRSISTGLATNLTNNNRATASMPGVSGNGLATQVISKRGETLLTLAKRLARGTSIDTYQLVASLYFNNPAAFEGGDAGQLRSNVALNLQGLNIPVVNAQGGGFNNDYVAKNRFNDVSVARPINRPSNSTTVVGVVKPKQAEKPVAAKQDQVKVAGSAKVGAGKLADPADQVADKRVVAEEQARKALLTKNVEDLKKSLEIKNNAITTPQVAILDKNNPKITANPSTSATVVKPNNSLANKADSKTDTSADPAKTNSAATTVTAAAASPTPAIDAKTLAPAATAVVSKPAQTPQATSTLPVSAYVEPSWYDFLLADPTLLGALGGVVLLGAGYAVYKNRKKKSNEFSDSQLDTATGQGALLTADGGHVVDTSNSLFASSFSPLAKPLETADIDPIAEADVYIQYGRDGHAADILLDALKTNPNQHNVRLKLMEIYANKGNTAQLEAQHTQLINRTNSSASERQAAMAIIASAKTRDMTQPTGGNKPKSLGGQTLIAPPTALNIASAASVEKKTSTNSPMQAGATLPPVLQQVAPARAAVQRALGDAPLAPATGLSGLTGVHFDVASPPTMLDVGAKNAPAAKPVEPIKADSFLDFKLSGMDFKPTITDLNTLSTPISTNNLQTHETKLNLAKAYLDIGDKEGAKELLQEVVGSGHQTLSDKAKQMLAKVS